MTFDLVFAYLAGVFTFLTLNAGALAVLEKAEAKVTLYRRLAVASAIVLVLFVGVLAVEVGVV